MFHAQIAGYIGKQPTQGFTGYICEGPFVIVLAAEEGIDIEVGKSILEAIKSSILHEHIVSLDNFESILSSQIFKHNLPAHFNLAAGYLYQDSLFIKTVGNGQVYFRRGKDFALLLTGDKSAQGLVQEYDCAILTTQTIHNVLGDVEDIQLFVDMNAPKDIVEKLQNEEYDEEERSFIVVFSEFTTQADPTISERNVGINPFSDHISEKEPVKMTPTVSDVTEKSSLPYAYNSKIKLPVFNLKGSKKIALILSVVLFGILLWSVVFGYQRREATRFAKQVDEVSQNIDKNIVKAQKEAFLNLDGSLDLLSQSKSAVADLKKESNGRNASEISEIEKRIKEAEALIVKKEEKEFTEFYDLELEDKKALSTNLAFEGDMVALLNANNKTIYNLSLGKKSLQKFTSSEVSNASLVSLYDETIYFFSKDNGIFKFTTENKVKNLIKADSDWGKIVDFKIFNGNIYLLDQEEGQVYKYVPTEGGYSDKSLYLLAENIDITNATALSIDASVYISVEDRILKFTRGEEEKFDTDFPSKSLKLSGLYTDSDIEQVYAWDKEHTVVYVLEKDGNYNRQIQTGILKNASGLFVKDKKLYILAGSKIYTITLD